MTLDKNALEVAAITLNDCADDGDDSAAESRASTLAAENERMREALDKMQRSRNRYRNALRGDDEARAIIKAFMACPELSDCDPRDKDAETLALESRALRFLNRAAAATAHVYRGTVMSDELSMSLYANSADYWKARASTLAAENERMREALEKIAAGREVRMYDGTTVVEDVENAAEIARAALTAPAPGGERNVSEPDHSQEPRDE